MALDELAQAEPEVEAEATTAIVVTDPEALSEEEQQRIAEVAGSIDTVVEAARAIEVRTEQEAGVATEFLARVSQERKLANAARTAIVKPLNDHVKFINGTFSDKLERLGEADGIVRKRVLGFQEEQRRKAAEEQARLDAERAEREREAAEERAREAAEETARREAAAREAAAAEAAARKAEQERREEEERLQGELADEMRGLDMPLLVAELESDDSRRARAADAELGRRDAEHRAEAARRAAEEAAEAERAAREVEEQARAAPVEDAPRAEAVQPGVIRSAAGSASTRAVWDFEVTDPDRVPREWLVVDEKAIRAAVKRKADPVREIPGVRIFPKDQLAVRSR
jgi:hypothetical protein